MKLHLKTLTYGSHRVAPANYTIPASTLRTFASWRHLNGRHLISSSLLIYRPRKCERLSWPSWLTYSGRYTDISGHTSAADRAEARESSPVRDRLQSCNIGEPSLSVVVVLTQRTRVLDVRTAREVPSLLAEARRRETHRLHGRTLRSPQVRHLLSAAVRRHPDTERAHRHPSPLDSAASEAGLCRQQHGRVDRTGGTVSRTVDDRGRHQQYDENSDHFGVSFSSCITSTTAGARPPLITSLLCRVYTGYM